ncbi:winged helix-turn-helix transcriptional regulator [Methylobacterium sp. J-077]|uniref:winged helix-turn-helix transcriptional regulator n=1 Tax=Methylobacterium sp. J-077 TaxID=2836656 RepID=UPI001FBB6747|nr:helix-turn-helix domain-containing protein [Methylobacterium sp. J-077]MCJ2125142.1 helix-turn-helix transcriptional regulator [Methylobacterium sp. J-077]
MKRKSFAQARCPVARSLDSIGDWWTLLLIRDALRGPRRFSDFVESLGLARNVLSARLRRLVEAGIFEQRPAEDGSDGLRYQLTEKGRGLQVVIMALRQWGEDNLFGEGEEMSVQVDRAGGPIRRLIVQATDGRPLRPEDVNIEPGHKRSRARAAEAGPGSA